MKHLTGLNSNFGICRSAVPFTFFSIFFLLFSIFCFLSSDLYAETKTWNSPDGEGEWSDETNWYPEGVPGSQDDVMINGAGAKVTAESTYRAKSLTLGGHHESSLTSEEFVSGTVEPASVNDVAILNRKDGYYELKGGAGTVHVRGTYKDSEESMAEKPSFVFYVK